MTVAVGSLTSDAMRAKRIRSHKNNIGLFMPIVKFPSTPAALNAHAPGREPHGTVKQ